MDPEVLIYINKLKQYLDTNKEARDHFLKNLDEEEYFEKVTEIAVKNFIEKNDPTLTMEQFEYVKKIMKVVEIGGRSDDYYNPIIFCG